MEWCAARADTSLLFRSCHNCFRNSFYWVGEESYVNWEPRFSLGWEFRQGLRAKAAYSRMSQYFHLLSSSGVGVPNDIWVPATENIPPAIAQQVGVSLEKNWSEAGISASLEMYHKTLRELPGFERGANLLRGLDDEWEANLLTGGEGRIQGMEFMLSREGKTVSGWMSYTLMRSERRFLQEGEAWFFDRFDRRHMFSMVLMMPMKRTWTFTCAFRYLTGAPVTAPIASQRDADGNLAFIYGARGNVRIPAYHRLDVGWERRFRNSEGKERGLHLGIYNLYNRQNPFYLEVVEGGGDELQFRQQSVFPILPSVSYSWYW
ncbi:MAG: TonB-dependent receptor [Bacteroidota bacterium]